MPKRDIETYAHTDKERVNNPPVGLVTPETDRDTGRRTYAHDPHLDPQLSWAGKAEHTSFEVPTVSLHVHERIDPRTIVESVRKRNGAQPQMSLFTAPEENPPLRQAIEFYRHRHNWTNRLIAGDSLLVMNSLIEKEGLGGQVQTVYLDPPYGIRYGSNFQPFVNRREVTDGKDEDLTSEPEQIRAFRDTWELGIHSYLAYLRDRLLLARELLHESGSCFVQIGDENVHRVGMAMDEIFGAENRVATISYATSGSSSANTLPQVADYLLWYAKDKPHLKYRRLYEPLTRAEVIESFSWHVMVELPDGQRRKPTTEECFAPDTYLPDGARIYARMPLDSQGVSTTGRSEPYEWNGRVFHCGKDRHWAISSKGRDRLAELDRLEALEGQDSLRWKRYADEVPGRPINNIWAAPMSPTDKRYVVETATKAIQRCILMTTDPGDLVFDPTCGSGTTAHVAEQWGRRWITCDTSRVAIAIARQRLMTANYDYYQLAHPDEGVGAGFRYSSVPTVSARTLAYDEPPNETMLYDQPHSDRRKARVTGPFTVEAVPAPVVTSVDEIVDPHPGPLPGGEGAMASPHPLEEGDTESPRLLGEGDRMEEGDVKNPLPLGEGRGEGKQAAPALDPHLLALARKLRKEQTNAEQLLWHVLRNRQFGGLKFRRQYPVAPYVLDFYCHEARLAIEVDEGQHSEPDKERRDTERTAYLGRQGITVIRFWNHEVLQETEAVLEQLYEALTPALSQREREKEGVTLSQGDGGVAGERPQGLRGTAAADLSIARSGETLRQSDWRDELLKTGIRGKAGQRISFARLEPLPATRWLHAEGETRPDAAGADHVHESAIAYTSTPLVVSFGPNHAPLEQRQVARAIEETQSLVPKPKMIVFAAFQFDPEAAKDIDETHWPGVTLLKAQMNADLLTEDLKKKRASNESFWLIGQPDVEVLSFQFLVFGEGQRRIGEYGAFKKLSGLDRLEEINRLDWQALCLYALLSQGRDVWHYLADTQGWDFDSGQYRGRPSQKHERGVPAVSWNSPRLVGGVGNVADDLAEFGISDLAGCRRVIERLRGDRQIAGRLAEIAEALNFPIQPRTQNYQLKTQNLHSLAVHGFDYYNTKTGNVESGGSDRIALWMLDLDYDGRSLFPRQVFFPMAGGNDGWAKLARHLRVEIDQGRMEAYRGTVSLPFEAGEHRRAAVKIVDDRGIESLKIVELG